MAERPTSNFSYQTENMETSNLSRGTVLHGLFTLQWKLYYRVGCVSTVSLSEEHAKHWTVEEYISAIKRRKQRMLQVISLLSCLTWRGTELSATNL